VRGSSGFQSGDSTMAGVLYFVRAGDRFYGKEDANGPYPEPGVMERMEEKAGLTDALRDLGVTLGC